MSCRFVLLATSTHTRCQPASQLPNSDDDSSSVADPPTVCLCSCLPFRKFSSTMRRIYSKLICFCLTLPRIHHILPTAVHISKLVSSAVSVQLNPHPIIGQDHPEQRWSVAPEEQCHIVLRAENPQYPPSLSDAWTRSFI